MENSPYLSIKSLFGLNYSSRSTYSIKGEYQIIHLHKNEISTDNSGNEMYTATLSDINYSYNKFIFYKKKDDPNLNIGQYIIVTKICPTMLNKQTDRVFLIKEYNISNKKSELLFSPLIKDNHTTNILDSPKKDEKDNKNYVNTKKDCNFDLKNNIDNNENKNKKNDYNNNENNEKNNNNVNKDNNYVPYSSTQNDSEFFNSFENSKYTPISHLTTFTKEFLIYVRVLSKSEKKIFSKNRSGHLFSFIVIDEFSSQIQIVCFDKLVDKYYDYIQENNIYEIRNGNIKINDRNFNNTNNDYKIILNENSSVNLINKEDNKLKKISLDLKTIKEIKNLSVNSVINIICIIINKGEIIKKNTKGGNFSMRRVIVSDKNKENIELTMWRNFAEINLNDGDILLCKKVRVNDFNGKNITTTNDTNIDINPKNNNIYNDEIEEIKKAFINENFDIKNNNDKIINSRENKNINNNNNTKIDFMLTILDNMSKYSEDYNHKFPFYNIKVTVTYINHNDKNFYPGCPNKECSRKLVYENKWVCNNCHKSFDYPKYYYSLNIRVKDCSCEFWVDIFDRVAENFLKINANNYRNLLIERDDNKLKEISNDILYKDFIFTIKVKNQDYNGVNKKKFSAIKIEKINYKKEAYKILDIIKEKLFFDENNIVFE